MIGWLHCPAGAAGDMLLGALLDAGAPLDPIRRAVRGLGVEPIDIEVHRVRRGGLAATAAHVSTSDSVAARTWPDVRGLIDDADLHPSVRVRAQQTFFLLATAEAEVHGDRPEEVHFHEVGALDAMADIVGVCAALHHLDITALDCSPVALGSGTVRGAHGELPVPAPAVLTLLRQVGAPVHGTDVATELCTPTGAALLAANVTGWGGMPPMRIRATGHGAGSRDLPELPNTLRIVTGESIPLANGKPDEHAVSGRAAASESRMSMLETNVDDLDPRVWPAVLDELLQAGAADAWLTPILMKKGRPAHMLSVLVHPEKAGTVRRTVFAETSTIGVRERFVDRTVLERGTRTIDVGGCAIRVKLAFLNDTVHNAQPEYEDTLAAARRLGRPVRAVLDEAAAKAVQNLLESPNSKLSPPYPTDPPTGAPSA